MKEGDAVFFKKARMGTHRKALEVTFKGHAYGVLLGHVPPFAKDPPAMHLLRDMGKIGFLSFDDVAEFLDDESAAKCVKKFEDKYYGIKVEAESDATAPGTVPAEEGDNTAPIVNPEAPV